MNQHRHSRYAEGVPLTSQHFEMYTCFHMHCEMAVKPLKYKSWMLSASLTRALKRYQRAMEGSKLFITWRLLHLSRNIDIANIWLNYCPCFLWGLLCLLLFFFGKTFMQLSWWPSLPCMNSHVLKCKCLPCLITYLHYLKPWSPQISCYVYNSGRKII